MNLSKIRSDQNSIMKIKSDVFLFIFIYLTLFFSSCQSNSVSSIEFDNLFKLENTIHIPEQNGLLLQGVYYPTVYEDKIFLPSMTMNDIYICDLNGSMIGSLNVDDRLNLRSPIEIIRNGENYYVADKGNHQIKKLNDEFQIESTIHINGQIEKILIPKNGDEIINHGTQRISNDFVLFKKYNNSNSEIAAFGTLNPKAVFRTWKTDIDDDGNIYLINVFENQLEIYSSSGRLSNKIRLKSSSIDSLLNTKGFVGKNPVEIIRSIENKPYYTINNITIYRDNILVQFQHSIYRDRFLLDIYNKQGKTIYSSIKMSERILRIEDGLLATFSQNSDSINSIDVRTYKIYL